PAVLRHVGEVDADVAHADGARGRRGYDGRDEDERQQQRGDFKWCAGLSHIFPPEFLTFPSNSPARRSSSWAPSKSSCPAGVRLTPRLSREKSSAPSEASS